MRIGYKIVLSMVLTVFEGPKLVAFLNRAGVLRQRTRGLLLQLFALSAVLFAAFYFNLLRYLTAADAAVLEDSDLSSPHDLVIAGVCHLAKNLLYGDRHRWLLRLAHLLLGVSLGSLTYMATALAAVALRSGKHHTLSSVLRKVRSNPVRPVLTAAGVCVLRAAVVAASERLLLPITGPKYIMVVGMFLALLAHGVLKAVCAVAVVASVAEPGLCGKGALARACRLMRGNKYVQALDSISMGPSSMLGRAFWLMRNLAAIAGLPARGIVKCLLLVVEEMISFVKVTEYYCECRNREEQEYKAGHRD